MISVDDDLLEPGLIADPFPYYRTLREQMPVHWNERWRGWVVSCYDDVYRGLHDPFMLADTVTPYFQTRLSEAQRKEFALSYEILNSWIVFLDAPKHTRYRKMLSRAFTPTAISKMRDVVTDLVNQCLATWEGKTEVDVIGDFAHPLPANVVATMIGAPPADMHLFQVWADAITNLLHGGVGSEDRLPQMQVALAEFKAYLAALYAARTEQPREDMMSWLIEALASDAELRADDVIYACMLLLTAGHETTQNLIGNTLTALLEAPDQVALLREQPELVKSAVEECLRFNGPMKGTMRQAARDMSIRDTAVREGDRILLLMASANRDPQKFVDPERLDITRNPNPHLSFGHGIHFCLGAPLARLELEIGLTEILTRYPILSFAAAPVYHPRILSRSIDAPLTLALGA